MSKIPLEAIQRGHNRLKEWLNFVMRPAELNGSVNLGKEFPMARIIAICIVGLMSGSVTGCSKKADDKKATKGDKKWKDKKSVAAVVEGEAVTKPPCAAPAAPVASIQEAMAAALEREAWQAAREAAKTK